MPALGDEESIVQEFTSSGNLDEVIPRFARDPHVVQRIESAVRGRRTTHELIQGDARSATALPDDSIHLVITSPPYWTLKQYNQHPDQLGHVADYDEFISALDDVWRNCFHALVPGGR